MKKKFSTKKFKTPKAMDDFLETANLSDSFLKEGVVKEPLIKKINLDLPESLIQQIDTIAQKIGVSRQPLLKIWIFERLKQEQITKIEKI